MTLVVPTNTKTISSGLLAKQTQIATLAAVSSSAPHASQSAQLAVQLKRELIAGLIEHGAILGGPAAILSSVSFTTAGPAASILSQIASLKTTIASLAVTNPVIATAKSKDLENLQKAAVLELLASGQMSADAILAAFAYTGPQ